MLRMPLVWLEQYPDSSMGVTDQSSQSTARPSDHHHFALLGKFGTAWVDGWVKVAVKVCGKCTGLYFLVGVELGSGHDGDKSK